jgi:DNA-binding transcriptional regulator YdaS (Cro superfamily)
MSFETALEQWQDGERRLADAPPDHQPALERATRRVEAELRRRLGGAFTAEELADLYDEGTDWTTDVAVAAAPDEPYAWDARVVGDAAFARYLRSAADFAGGRRRY